MTQSFRLAHVALFLLLSGQLNAQDAKQSKPTAKSHADAGSSDDPQADVLNPEEWRRVDAAVDRALVWLAAQQQPDGSFQTIDSGQSGVTSLCVLAFLAHGNNPGEGQYGGRLERATNFIMSCQKENGLVARRARHEAEISRDVDEGLGVTTAYNHAIGSLTLSEIYGMKSVQSDEMQKAITKSLAATLQMQRWPKDREADKGGWRYLYDYNELDSDLSLTGWNLMFLRSARNAGFDVPKQSIDDAVAFVRRTFDKDEGVFRYTIGRGESYSRAMAGAGILALAHAGYHNSVEAQTSAKWLRKQSLAKYNTDGGIHLDRYHYSLFNSCYAMYQLGGADWAQFFPPTVRALLSSQATDGSWDEESFQRDRAYGKSYTTALVVLSLGAPNQFLPVFQR